MTQTLYSLRTDPSGYRITKFVDGEVESSYLTSTDACECPAGHRHTCRHRQMLPQMLAHGIADTYWFMDWDRSGSIVDFNGASKRLYDQLATAATGEISETLAVGEALLVAEDTTPLNITATEIDERFKNMPPMKDALLEHIVDRVHEATDKVVQQQQPSRSWRRL